MTRVASLLLLVATSMLGACGAGETTSTSAEAVVPSAAGFPAKAKAAFADPERVSPASIAGNWVFFSNDMETVPLVIGVDGTVSARAGSCRLSGRIDGDTVAGANLLEIHTQGCDASLVNGRHLAVVDRDVAPASFRLIAAEPAATADADGILVFRR